MTDKDLQYYLLAVLGIFALLFLTLVGSSYFGESTWMKVVIPVAVVVATLLIVSWARRVIK